MCYLFHEKHAAAAEGRGATLPPSLERLRPRMIGAVAAALIGGLALAAMVSPSASRLASEKDSGAAVAPLAASTGPLPTTSAADRSLPMDDGVPSSSDMVKAGLGHCDHSL